MVCTTYCDYIEYTKDQDINGVLDLVRPYFKNSNQIFVSETLKCSRSNFFRNKKVPMYHIHWLVSYHEYQVLSLAGGSDKEHIIAYLYGLLNGLITFAHPKRKKLLKGGT